MTVIAFNMALKKAAAGVPAKQSVVKAPDGHSDIYQKFGCISAVDPSTHPQKQHELSARTIFSASANEAASE